MWYQSFPTSLNDIPRSFLSQFEDISYRNDQMASFLLMGVTYHDSTKLKLWIDHHDIDKREESNDRFCVMAGADEAFSCEELPELITYLELHLDTLRIETLLSIADTEQQQCEAIGYDYTNTGEFKTIYLSFINEAKRLELDVPEAFDTYEANFADYTNLLEQLAVKESQKTMNADPTEEHFQHFLSTVDLCFPDKTELVLELMGNIDASFFDFINQPPTI
ncbi:MAG: hypothetical protein MJK15_00775 [Colwellia sp.]|nr:hypothetical protein [Colwellia sp.]